MIGAGQAALLGITGASGPVLTPTTWKTDFVASGYSYSNGDLTATRTTADSWLSCRSVEGVASGKWRWRITCNVTGAVGGYMMAGIAPASFTNTGSVNFWSTSQGGRGLLGFNAAKYYNGSTVGAYIYHSTVVGRWVDVILNMDTGKLWFSNSETGCPGDPVAGTGEAFSGITGTMHAVAAVYYNTQSHTANFGATSFGDAGYTGYTNGLGVIA